MKNENTHIITRTTAKKTNFQNALYQKKNHVLQGPNRYSYRLKYFMYLYN